MKKTKKIFAWLLVLNLLLTLLPAGLADAVDPDSIPQAQVLGLATDETPGSGGDSELTLELAREGAANTLVSGEGDAAANGNSEANDPKKNDPEADDPQKDDPEGTLGQQSDGEGAAGGEEERKDETPGDGNGEGEAGEGGEDAPQLVTETIETIVVRPSDTSADNNALFAGYAQKQFDAARGRRMLRAVKKAGYASLKNDAERLIYNAIAKGLPSVAEGKQDSTVFSVPIADLAAVGIKTVFTQAELDAMEDSSRTNTQKVSALFFAQFDNLRIMNALLADFPYELYWFDKVTGMGVGGAAISYYPVGENTEYTVNGNLALRMAVAQSYAVGTYTFDTGKAKKVQTAVAQAQAIVKANAGKSDYAKLLAYKNAICDRVSYNGSAANNSSMPYGDPWQLIYVFDGDTDTNVVCEGYAKAFQYLCDLSNFNDATCYTISGDMVGGRGEGPHMWNIVTIGGKNYLVDVTNCDAGAIGAPDKLFLKGYDEHPADNTYVCSGVTYTYNASALALYPDDDRAVAGSDYERPTYAVTVTAEGENGQAAGKVSASASAASVGETVTLTADQYVGPEHEKYRFKEWQVVSGDVTITNPASYDGASFTMPDAAAEVKAVYERVYELYLYTYVGPNMYGGSLISGTHADGDWVAVGETMRLQAVGDDSYKYSFWRISAKGGSKDIYDQPDLEYTVAAEDVIGNAIGVKGYFGRLWPITVTAEPGAGGTASADRQEAVAFNTVTLTAAPNPGYVFKEWKVISGGLPDGIDVDPNDPLKATFLLYNGPVTIQAVFEGQPYDVTLGTNLPKDPTSLRAKPNPAKAGETVTLNTSEGILRVDGYYSFQRWEVVSGDVETINGISQATGATFTMPAGPVKVQAVYAKVYNVSVTSEGNGGNETNAKAVPSAAAQGREVKLTADQYVGTDRDKCRFKEWQVVSGDVTITNPTSYDGASFTMPDGPVEVKAVFGRMYQLYIVVHGTGTVSPADAEGRWVVEGEKVVLTAEPGEGCGLHSWDIPRRYTTIYDQAVLEYTVAPGDADDNIITIVANFAPLHAITVTAAPEAGGTATADKAQAAQYNTVTLTAAPNPGYVFKEWKLVSGGVMDGRIYPDPNDPLKATFRMDWRDVEIQAVFERQPCAVTVTAEGEDGLAAGKVSASASAAPVGARVTLTAPEFVENSFTRYRFKEWRVVSGFVTITNPTSYDGASFSMPDEAVVVLAVYERVYQLSIAVIGTGTVSPADADGRWVTEGEKVALTAEPEEGCGLSYWYILGSDTTIYDQAVLEYTVDPYDAVDNIISIYANFTPLHAITVTAAPEAGGTASADKAKAARNNLVTLTAAPNPGYVFKEWRVVSGRLFGITPNPNDPLKPTFRIFDSDVEIQAVFERETCAVTVTAEGEDGLAAGKVSASPSAAAEGEPVTLTAAERVGTNGIGVYRFKEWQAVSGGVTISNPTSYDGATFTMPAGPVAVKAVYERVYRLVIMVWGTGTVSPADADGRWVTEGEKVVLTAEPGEGYGLRFWLFPWSGAQFYDQTVLEYTVAPRDADDDKIIIEANFAPLHAITVTAAPEAGGTATADKAQAAQYNTVTLTAAPNAGYAFAGWTVVSGGVTVAAPGSAATSFTMGDQAVELQAAFVCTHSSLTPVAAVAAGCETAGNIAYYKCDNADCGKLFSDAAATQEISLAETAVKALGHDYAAEVTQEATCAEDGVRTYTCRRDASHTYTETIPAKGHTLHEVPAAPATCDADGNSAHYYCSACHKRFADGSASRELTRAEYFLPATGHDWGDWEVTTPATEASAGVETRVCRNDSSHTETRTIPQLGHTHRLEPVAAVAPTCTTAGSAACYRCAGCGKLFRDSAGTEEIDAPDAVAALGHAWSDWSVSSEATCGADGLQIRTCARCDGEETQTLPATGAHAWGEWTITTAATCVDAGEQTRACAVCGATETESIPATGEHAWGDWTITTAATCVDAGEQTRACTVCGATETESIPATGEHAWGEWTVAEEATCGKAGEQTRACAVCGATETESIPATGEHTWGKPVVRTVPTANSDGVLESTCAVCGETRKSAIPASEKRYYIAEGDNSTYYKQEGAKAPRIVVKATVDDAHTYDRFLALYVDNLIVPQNAFTAERGSVDITLRPEFVNTLSTGAHTLTAVFEDGYAEARLTVLARSTPTEKPDDKKDEKSGRASGTPKTGDQGNLVLWLVLTLAALAGCCAVVIYDRRKKAGK